MAVTITSPSAGQQVSGVITVKATYDGKNFNIATLVVDGKQVASDSAQPIEFSLDTRNLTDGSHVLRVAVRFKRPNGTFRWQKTEITVNVKNAVTSEWTKVANEYESFSLGSTAEVRYGKDSTWVSKTLSAGTHMCNNDTFGDPVPGVTKECQVRVGVEPPPPPPPPPPSGDWPASYFTGPLGANNPLPPKGRAFLGIFPNTIGFDWNRQRSFVAEREQAIGRRFDMFMFAYPPEVWSQDRVTWVSQNGYIPVISGLHWGTTVYQVAAGENDAQIRALADELKTKPLCLIRMFHEFDNPHVVYTAVGREQAFVDAWKRTVEIFQQQGAINVGWFVCPNEGHTRSAINRVRELLPEAYYDWAGSDWYNWCYVSESNSCWSTPLHGGWAEFWEVFNYQNPPGGEKTQHDQWGPRKPFVIGETNTVYDAQNPLRKGDWYRNVVADSRGAKAMPHLVGVLPYDADVSSVEGGKANFLVDYSTQYPAIFDGFKTMARDPYWLCRGS